jgi:hypothetical protein
VSRDLDSLDLQLLVAMLQRGLSPTDLHVHHRLDRLEMEGYTESVPNNGPDPNAADSRIYTLTEKGRRAARSGD